MKYTGNKKNNFKHITLVIVFLSLLLLSPHFLIGQEKPNILWITIEDTSPQFIGCYGNKDAKTPNIDKLASQGVRFLNAFSTGTVCSPSRSTIITGVHTFEMGTGHQRSTYPLPQYIKGFPVYLKEQGYYVTNNGKTDYNIANADAFTKEAWHESSNNAGWWKRKPGQPFFSVFNVYDSHQSRTMTNPYKWYEKHILSKLLPEEQIAEDAFEMPPFYNDTPEMRKYFARVYNSIKLTDKNIGVILDRLEKDNLTDSTIIFFYADHGEGIPRAKANGINLGYRVPFVVWFPEMYKHLSPWGTGGVVTDELIDFKDLAPTIINLAGGNIPDYMKGKALLGKNRSEPAKYLELSTDRVDNGIDMVRSITNGRYIYSRNFMPFMPQQRYINYFEIGDITKEMRKDYKNGELNDFQSSIFKDRPAEYLYDIEKDIWEEKNLVDKPKFQKILVEMRKQLKNRMLSSQDVFLLPEYEFGKITEHETLYEFRKDKVRFPVEEIYEAAELSGKRSDAVAKEQIQLLKSNNKIVRYWAVIGLRSQTKEILEPYKNQIIKATQDAYPPVAVTASAIAFQTFKHKGSKQNIIKFSKSSNKHIALMTVNYLLYVDDKELFVDVVFDAFNKPDQSSHVKSACTDFLNIMGFEPTKGSGLIRTDDYLYDFKKQLDIKWPWNKTLNIVFHGHSVPSGYYTKGNVHTLSAYPHLFLEYIKDNYKYAVANSITTSIGGEQAERGAKRFKDDVLKLNPDVLFIDYALNDRNIGLERAEKAWRSMIDEAIAANVKVVLMTPTPDLNENILDDNTKLAGFANLITRLAKEYNIPVVDVYGQFKKMKKEGVNIDLFMSQNNHPNSLGHKVVLIEIVKALF